MTLKNALTATFIMAMIALMVSLGKFAAEGLLLRNKVDHCNDEIQRCHTGMEKLNKLIWRYDSILNRNCISSSRVNLKTQDGGSFSASTGNQMVSLSLQSAAGTDGGIAMLKFSKEGRPQLIVKGPEGCKTLLVDLVDLLESTGQAQDVTEQLAAVSSPQ